MKSKTKNTFAEICSSIISGVISFFMLLLVLIFPLIYHDNYFDILKTKYQCYWGLALAMLSVCLILALIMLIIDIMEHKGIHARQLFRRLHPVNWKDTFTLTDAAIIIFWIVLGISTLQSDYLYEAFWGNEGRLTGLFLLTIYIAVYFVISRFWTVKKWILEVFLFSGMIICIIGITDYFQLDVLGFRLGYRSLIAEESTIYTSTIGNINTYTTYVALIMALSSILFAITKKGYRLIWYYLCMVISFCAIITGRSDNAYLSVGALFVLAPIKLFEQRDSTRRYLLMVASFVSVIQWIDWMNQWFSDVVIGLDSLFQVIIVFKGLPYTMVLLWLLVIAMYCYDNKKGKSSRDIQKYLVRLWLVFLGIAIMFGIFMFCDANFLGHADRYGKIGYYLVFNDGWGTNRGYIWRKSMELYRDFTPMHKIFGYGPDTFGILTVTNIAGDMLDATTQIFDNAHNEYLQYLITIGPIGLLTYILFLLFAIRTMWQNANKQPYILACSFVVICYAAQALVNLSLPIATPMMWLLLSIGIAGVRGSSRNE